MPPKRSIARRSLTHARRMYHCDRIYEKICECMLRNINTYGWKWQIDGVAVNDSDACHNRRGREENTKSQRCVRNCLEFKYICDRALFDNT